ncbi:hypothetical protein, partial [Burkholderia vietnamiensis]|uniref:hypothetical protein n=1 Tax=Burkholderia vietnamiensis TaxID=60552 RepID=UPI002012DD3D
HQPPTRPGDNTPRIMTATGGGNHAGPGWPKPRLSGREDSNGGEEDERREVRALWLPVGRALYQKGLNVLCTADFHVEMSSIPGDYLAMKASQWLSSGGLFPLTWSDAISAGKIERLNLQPLQKLLATDNVALNSTAT